MEYLAITLRNRVDCRLVQSRISAALTRIRLNRINFRTELHFWDNSQRHLICGIKIKPTDPYIQGVIKSIDNYYINDRFHALFYLEDKTCNLVLVFLVLCHMQQRNHLGTSCNFQQRGRHCQRKNLLKRNNNEAYT